MFNLFSTHEFEFNVPTVFLSIYRFFPHTEGSICIKRRFVTFTKTRVIFVFASLRRRAVCFLFVLSDRTYTGTLLVYYGVDYIIERISRARNIQPLPAGFKRAWSYAGYVSVREILTACFRRREINRTWAYHI